MSLHRLFDSATEIARIHFEQLLRPAFFGLSADHEDWI